nr:AbgT family transporter [Lysinibacillus timonensis]
MGKTQGQPETNAMDVQRKGFFLKSLDRIEKLGNKLPDITTLFIIITIIILIASWFFNLIGWKAINPTNNETIAVTNLLNGDGMVRILTEAVSNFMNFPPLGMVLVAMLGVGLAESTGMISAVMRKTVLSAPQFLILPIIALVGIVGNAAADAAFVVLPPIAAMLFLAIGKNPIAGLAAGYASVATGFSANLILNVLDVAVAGFTQSAAVIADPNFVASPAMNYYFTIVSTFVLIPVVVFVNNKLVEPRLGAYVGDYKGESSELTIEEKRGLKWAGWAFLAFVIVLVAVTLPENSFMRDSETGSITSGPFMKAIIPIILLTFFIPALAYGFGAKVLKNDKDIADHLSKTLAGLSYYILLSFIAAQMIAYFSWSNLGPVIAINGAEWLQNIGFEGLPLLIIFIIFCATINLLIASATAKWAMLAPVFVPMFMYLGYNPAVTQMAYRIGDSITNTITPMLAYFAILLMVAQKYDKNMKIGTLISILIPYTIMFGIVWIIFFAIWYLLGLPLGPGYGVHL